MNPQKLSHEITTSRWLPEGKKGHIRTPEENMGALQLWELTFGPNPAIALTSQQAHKK